MAKKSHMDHSFANVPSVQIPRASFQRDSTHKTTFDAGYLVPIFVEEALPGDTHNVNLNAFARLATPIVPFMDNLIMETFFFSVPYRQLWNNFERFMGAQDTVGESTDYLVPQCPAPNGGWTTGSLGDYFGLPLGIEFSANALPFRAYNKIFNDWFRKQDLVDSANENRLDGPDSVSTYPLRRRAKRPDYITSSLPWPQKGESVDLPLGTRAPVLGIGSTDTSFSFPPRDNIIQPDGSTVTFDYPVQLSTDPNTYFNAASGAGPLDVYADLGAATSATINQLRQSMQIQRLLERDARGGTRYIEIMKSHFQVDSDDHRLFRSEYLGGGRSYISVSPVAQTAPTDENVTPQGNLAAVGTATLSGHGFTKSFTEHCIVIGLVNVRADLTYQQGIHRMWSRRTKYDHYWPALAQIGEQAVLNKEVYADGTEADEEAWGYQERYGEYRYRPSIISGAFRSTAPQPLDVWHLGEYFTSRPTLNSTFISAVPPVDRVIAVQDEPQFLFDGYFSVRSARPMPLFGVPGMLDHF